MSSRKKVQLTDLTTFGCVTVGKYGNCIVIHPTLSGSLLSPEGARQLAEHLVKTANSMIDWDREVIFEKDLPKPKKGKIRVKRRKNK